MDWIFEHFQIVLLILLGIGSMAKSLYEKAKGSREVVEMDDPEDVFAPDESYRKLQPSVPPSVPPPLVRSATPPSLRMAGYDAESAAEAAKVLKHQRNLAARQLQIRQTKATTTGGASATRARIAGKGAAMPVKQTPLTLRTRLRNPAEVRRAIVMREILDPPLGLR